MEDKYITYSSHQLAGEESFIRWVLHGETDDQWSRWLQDHPAFEEKMKEARQIIIALTHTPAETFPEAERIALWNRIDQSARSDRSFTAQRNLQPLWKWTVAAAAALLLMVWFNSLTYRDMVYTMAGEKKEISLPEKSMVTLNAGSMLEYKSKSFDKDRILRLEGEAFFNVTPGSTFTVKTESGMVTVLGTSFNILSRQGRFEVSCYSGKVQVESGDHDQVILGAGERSIQNQDDLKLNRSPLGSAGNTPEWMQGKFNFENQPLVVVIAELERQYDVKVKLAPELEELKYTGLFESGDLEKALALITWPLHLKASIEGKTVMISR